ncbi:MAG: SPFH domain-containing protein [Lachnospiraceae bacterium]|nr:SPFH domain-containing protein [Lachnospiraceae bacterium]
MGIIKATVASVSSLAADQWKEFFICNAIPADTMMVRGIKMTSSNSSNQEDSDMITDGSIIAVADGQCAIVVSGGKVISTFMEPGENVYESGVSPGIFGGATLKTLGREVGRRISFGGEVAGVVQRVYYMNLKEIPGVPFGNGTQIPFRIHDEDRNLDIDCSLVVSGLYSFRICDPAKIYKQLIGNVDHDYKVSYLISQMNSEVNTCIMTALGGFSNESFRTSELGNIIYDIEAKVKDAANAKLRELRGIEILSLGFSSFNITENDTGIIREIQKASAATNPEMAAAILTSASAEAMAVAAANPSGSGVGLMGMSMAGADAKVNFCPECGAKVTGGKFCRECGYKF